MHLTTMVKAKLKAQGVLNACANVVCGYVNLFAHMSCQVTSESMNVTTIFYFIEFIIPINCNMFQ